MNNPLSSFAIEPLLTLDLNLIGIKVSLTNNSLYLLLSVFLLVLALVGYNLVIGNPLVPSNLSLIGETLHACLLGMSRSASNSQVMLPVLLALFGIILFANLLSNITYGYASASAISFSIGLSFTVFIGVTVLAISVKGWSFLATFVPAGTPNALLPALVVIELVSYLARAISLGVRLFANLVAGHALLTILSSLTNKLVTGVWWGIASLVLALPLLVALVGLEVGVAVIQAYVFTILTAIYIDEAIKPLA